MRSGVFLRKVAELEEEVRRLYQDLPSPVFDFMKPEELFALRDLLQEGLARDRSGSIEDIPEAMAIWNVACARVEKRLAGKQSWPHWRKVRIGAAKPREHLLLLSLAYIWDWGYSLFFFKGVSRTPKLPVRRAE